MPVSISIAADLSDLLSTTMSLILSGSKPVLAQVRLTAEQHACHARQEGCGLKDMCSLGLCGEIVPVEQHRHQLTPVVELELRDETGQRDRVAERGC